MAWTERRPNPKCEETDCTEPALWLVDNGDEHPYRMCMPHTKHNVRNRGAVCGYPMNLDQLEEDE